MFAWDPEVVHRALEEGGKDDLVIHLCGQGIDSGLLSRAELACANTDRGRAYINKGEFDRAVADLQAALRQDPGWEPAHYYLGIARYNRE